MFIQTEQTPNPATLKFLPGRTVMESGTANFPERSAAARSPLAERLFQLPEVGGVFLGSDFITVTKSRGQRLAPAEAGGAGGDHGAFHFRASGDRRPAGSRRAPKRASEEDDEIVAQIKELLETRVRPAVAMDGGDITFEDFEDGIVYLHMQGACSGCPSSTATLKAGIENMLRHYIPEVVEVRAV